MGLIYRTSSLANGAATSIKNAPLSYEEGDGNIAFLLTNLSGSNTIQGTTTVDGPIQINDTIQIDGIVLMPQLTSASQNSIVTYDSSSGRFYYTASSAAIQPTVVSAIGSTLYSITPAAGGPGSFNNTNSIFFGDSSADGAIGADNAIFMGYRSGRFASNARYCIFLGADSGYNAYSAFHSVFVGSYAGSGTEDATYSNFIGYSAGASATSAQYSNFMGREAGAYADSAVYSNFIGYNAGAYATNAQYSNFIGFLAGNSAISASYSVFLGYGAGETGIGLNGPGRNNIIIGTRVTLEDDRRDSINIGGIIYGTGSYYSTSTTTELPVSNGRIGIGISVPKYTLDVSGSGNYSNGLLVTGSLSVSQAINAQSFTGSLFGTSSWANNALTASLAPNYLPLTGGTINGNVTVNGTASIAFLNVTVESASVIYSSGSNQFGDAANDTQTLYGTVAVPNGNVVVTGSVIATQGFTGSLFGTSSWAQSASYIPSLQEVTTTGNTTTNGITSKQLASNTAYIIVESANGNELVEIGYQNSLGPYISMYSSSLNYGTIKVDTLTGARTYQLPNDSGTIALVSNTGSLLTTASVSLNTITFTKGDGSTFPITVNTGSGGSGGSINTGSLLTTASVSLNTIMFTKGDGTTFPITVDTGSGGGGSTQPGGSDTFIQFNSGSEFGATSSFAFDYNRQALAHGYDINAFSTPGMYSHAQGDVTYALGDYSHAEGGWSNAIAIHSHAEGYGTIAYGSASHAEGNYTATGTQNAWSGSWRLSHVTMSGVHGNVTSSFNVGDRLYLYRTSGIVGQVATDRVISSSFYDNVSGNTILGVNLSIGSTRREVYIGNTALTPNSWTGGGSYTIPAHKAHSEGNNTIAIGESSHAEGQSTVSYGLGSHAEGFGSSAIGPGSHAEGYGTEAIADYSHAEGISTRAAGAYQTVVGAYNITSSLSSAFIVGNGDFTTRRNLLFAQGNTVQITGSLNVSGSITGSLFGTSSWAVSASWSPTPTLQQITDVGNTTTNDITINKGGGAYLTVQNTLVPKVGYIGTDIGSSAVLGLSNIASNVGEIYTENITANRTYQLPDENGTFVLKINGISANSSGSVTIPTGSFLTTGSLSTTQQLSGSLNVTGSLNFFSGSTNAAKIENGWVVLSQVSMSLNFANDSAAAAGGVPLGGLYRNGNVISIRIA